MQDLLDGKDIEYEVEEGEKGPELKADIEPDVELASDLVRAVYRECFGLSDPTLRASFRGAIEWNPRPGYIEGWNDSSTQDAKEKHERRKKERKERQYWKWCTEGAGGMWTDFRFAAEGDTSRLEEGFRQYKNHGTFEGRVEKRNENGVTMLAAAACFGHAETTQMLLEEGADPDLWDMHRRTPLHYAAIRGHPEVARLLLDAEARTDLPDIEETGYRTPLHYAAAEGHAEVVHHLLEADACTEVRDGDGKMPLDLARQNGHAGVAALLTGEKSFSEVAEEEKQEASDAEDAQPEEKRLFVIFDEALCLKNASGP
ncbi:MAG: ankyrin repeat domain-containing protein, partial [Planctomycetota bacterium]